MRAFTPDQFHRFEQGERHVTQKRPIDRKVNVCLQTGRIDQANRKIFGLLHSQLDAIALIARKLNQAGVERAQLFIAEKLRGAV